MIMGSKYKIILFIFFCWISNYSLAQNRIPAFEMNERLGRGINMGNCFEAPSEAEWGNPWNPEYFKIIADLGFDHVRLPVRWEPDTRSMADPPYTINPTFLSRIQQVVDTAIRYDLHIIINMHHHDSLFANPEAEKARFLAQWFQIADYFKDYPDNLLFEVLNEPHGEITSELWNEFFADALAEIRKTNPTRVVILGVADFGGLGGIANLVLPNDEYIILSPHYYNPFNFTHQGAEWVGPQADEWLGTKWNDTEADRETVANEFRYAQQFSETNHIPIHVGEFGSYSTADIESRERWTNFLARWFEEQNFSWAYWEFSAGFGIYDPTTKQFLEPLVNALLVNEMAEPTPILSTTIYTSNFSGGTDGWTLTTQGGASGSLVASGGKLNTTISSPGTESWHVQLVKNNIPLTKNKMYRISFKAQALANRSATFYAGKASDPWNAYSGYNGLSISITEENFSYNFTMNNPSDPAARLVFDLGTNATGVIISEVKVEELKFVITALDQSIRMRKNKIYPNPVSSVLNFEAAGQFNKVEFFDLNGKSVVNFNLQPGMPSINLEGLPSGIYLIKLSGDFSEIHDKIVKD